MEQRVKTSGSVVDIVNRRIVDASIDLAPDGTIAGICPERSPDRRYILPGFIDAHVHVESSMLTPTAFAQEAVRHGTVAAVTDPHEIANVLGLAGIDFMLAEAARTPFLFATGAPSCVPATPFETAGATLDAKAVARLLDRPAITHLAEMMNVPGVLAGDADVLAKLAAARLHGKPVDGHAPGLRGHDLGRYIEAGVSTDHECLDLEEALEKAARGMHIQLRQGSAARQFEIFLPVLRRFPSLAMFCADDKHPDDLLRGYIDELVRIAVRAGVDLFDVLRAASLNPARHYGLNMGLLQPGDRADWIEVADLKEFRVLRTVIAGQVVADAGETRLPTLAPLALPNRFQRRPVTAEAFRIPARSGLCRVIGVRDGELVTDSRTASPTIRHGQVVADPERDLVKLAVLNRYAPDTPPALALVAGTGLQRGAFTASIAHDSHHVIAAGADDAQLAAAVNAVVAHTGGLATADEQTGVQVLPLPIAGLMGTASCQQTAADYTRLAAIVRGNGCTLRAPFMTLSFLALPVIPALKLTDSGLFDGLRCQHVDLWTD
ncbi:MAG: adenine deaminase [Desulfobulbus sp.]|jgi:adenine deaminase|uniref:adenine deaminase n=1 Tax=Desulfobulbus sp. TaxID=895 RepID=UPI00284A6A21|nr:adenine deaminase [Desulfobulbus sp.]MDR2550276.1 adenine deaminase [Desulfobulbus sp.]